MKKRLVAPLAILIALGSASGVGIAASNGHGEGHTPVHVCHWVPANGGSYVSIVVDDDAASGNKDLQGHAGHVNDLIGVDECPTGGTD